jgi:hypothetical protein
MWIAIIALILLLGIGGTATYVIIQNQNSPTATLQKFCNGFKDKNAQEVYETLSTGLRAQATVVVIQHLLDSYTSLDCTVSNVQQNDLTATGTITLTATQGGTSHSSSGTIPLVKEDGQWKISSLNYQS